MGVKKPNYLEIRNRNLWVPDDHKLLGYQRLVKFNLRIVVPLATDLISVSEQFRSCKNREVEREKVFLGVKTNNVLQQNGQNNIA